MKRRVHICDMCDSRRGEPSHPVHQYQRQLVAEDHTIGEVARNARRGLWRENVSSR